MSSNSTIANVSSNRLTNPNSVTHSIHPNSLNYSPLPTSDDKDDDSIRMDFGLNSNSVCIDVSENAKFHTTLADASSYKIVTCFCKKGEQLAKTVPISRKLSDGT